MNSNITKREYIINLCFIVSSLLLVAKLFYGKFIVAVFLLPLTIPIMCERKHKIQRKKKRALEKQFKEMLISLSDALNTGYSLENAVGESYRDMISLYGYHGNICVQLRQMISQIKLNVTVETVFRDFGKHSGLKNAVFFANIISVVKRTGGNMTELIKNVTENIVLKETVREEIEVMIHEKKMEQKVMLIIPLVLILYVNVTSPGFLSVMYQGIIGPTVMTIFVILYAAAYLWTEKCIEKGERWE